MDRLYLVKPCPELEKEIWQYRQEYMDFGETRINGSCGLARFDDFGKWLRLATSIEKDALSKDGVHASTFFSVRESDRKIIGSVQLRHTLTEGLRQHGGHIGYGIRPTERRKGYGTAQLLLILEEARRMQLPGVMVMCDRANVASSRTILRCGGILSCANEYDGVAQEIYWIALAE